MATQPLFALTDTWDTTATTYAGLALNVTDTASAATSLLMDLQIGGASKAHVAKAGALRIFNSNDGGSNFERAKIAWSSNVLQIGTEKLGTGTARALEFQTDGTTRLTISAAGAVQSNGNFEVISSSSSFGTGASATTWVRVGASTTSRSQLRLSSGVAPTSPVDGDVWFDGTDVKIQVGGVTKTFTLV